MPAGEAGNSAGSSHLTFFTLLSRSMLPRDGAGRGAAVHTAIEQHHRSQTSAALRQWLQPNKGRAAANPRPAPNGPPANQRPRPALPCPSRPVLSRLGAGSGARVGPGFESPLPGDRVMGKAFAEQRLTSECRRLEAACLPREENRVNRVRL